MSENSLLHKSNENIPAKLLQSIFSVLWKLTKYLQQPRSMQSRKISESQLKQKLMWYISASCPHPQLCGGLESQQHIITVKISNHWRGRGLELLQNLNPRE